MPGRKPHQWNAKADAAIRDGRAAGKTWEALGAILGMSGWAVNERGRKIKVAAPPKRQAAAAPTGREPMRAGDPVSWGAINNKTALEGEAYNYTTNKTERGG